jgi:TusA-related sulfurtransferase
MRCSDICHCYFQYKWIVSNKGGFGVKKIVDACGLSCPEPVLKLKQVINGADEIELLVDSQVCVDNCSRFAESKGFCVSVNGGNGQYAMTLTKG